MVQIKVKILGGKFAKCESSVLLDVSELFW